jgi:hypothetical protein
MVQMAQPTWAVVAARQVIASHQIRKEQAEAAVRESLLFATQYPSQQHQFLTLPMTLVSTPITSRQPPP